MTDTLEILEDLNHTMWILADIGHLFGWRSTNDAQAVAVDFNSGKCIIGRHRHSGDARSWVKAQNEI